MYSLNHKRISVAFDSIGNQEHSVGRCIGTISSLSLSRDLFPNKSIYTYGEWLKTRFIGTEQGFSKSKFSANNSKTSMPRFEVGIFVFDGIYFAM